MFQAPHFNTPPDPGEAEPLSGAQREVVDQAIAAWRDRAGPLIPVLQEIQKHLGFVPRGAMTVIGSSLGLSRAEVYGVVSFYHDFRQQPPAERQVRICRAESCQAMGSEALWDQAQELVGRQGDVDLSEVFCLGLCACSPALEIDGRLHARVTSEMLSRLLRPEAEAM